VIKFSEQQLNAIDTVHKRIKMGEPVTRLFGYAGTGKTTIAQELARTSSRVLYAAFTGKAASVLTRKGCPASTIHSLIYTPTGSYGDKIEKLKKQLEDDPKNVELAAELKEARKRAQQPGFKFDPEGSELNEADLLVLDEVSMVDQKIANDLLSFGVPILALGDPAQLPPVGSGGYFTKGGEKAADALLTQVERHTGAVIDLATRIRKTQERPEVNGSTVVRRIGQQAALGFDQVLVGTNKTRWAKNRTLRRLLGHGDQLLYPNERIICLGNNKDLGVLNGQQFIVAGIQDGLKENTTEGYLTCECDDPAESEQLDYCSVCHWRPRWIPMWDHGFEGIAGETELKEISYGKSKTAMHATYGYAITVHKSQGSEWGNVLIIDESPVFRKDGWRWLYTAVTRAQNNVVVLKG